MIYQLRDYQQKASDAAVSFFGTKSKNKNGLIVLPTGCHAKGTKIICADGSLKLVEDVAVGDMLLGVNGYRKVLQLHRGVDDMYKITPIKGKPFVVNKGHILHLYKTNEGKNSPSCKPRYDDITVGEYIGKSSNYKHLHKLRRVSSCDFDTAPQLEIEPYMLGLLLGDGYVHHSPVSITTMNEEVKNYIYEYAEHYGYSIRDDYKGGTNKAHSYHIISRVGKKSIFGERVKKAGIYGKVSGDKFIPQCYLSAPKQQRLELLAGLVDTDSYYDKIKNLYEYCTKSLQLAKDVQFLSRSLGFMCEVKQKVVNGVPYYRMNISGDLDMIPNKIEIRKGRKREQKKSTLVTGFSVEYVGVGEYYGFTLDGDHLYCDEQFFIHHNSGKSLVIADIASKIDEPLIVLQPSKEILEQNYAKLRSYDVLDCSIYSASLNRKEISRITFATIGSVMSHLDEFDKFKKIIVDECHMVNPFKGQYKDFFEAVKDRKVVGLTATPYRLSQTVDPKTMNSKYPTYGSILKFLTRTRPRVFTDVLYYCQVADLLSRGYLARLRYFDMNQIDLDNVRLNTTGADYDDRSLFREFERVGLHNYTLDIVRRLLKPKNGIERNGILVFTKFVEDAERLAEDLGPICEVVSGSTPKKEREEILENFKAGYIKVVANVGVLTTGFDFPALDTIVLARPTMSLALYYQMVGRAIRPYENKEGWIVDLCGSVTKFGKVEDLEVKDTGNGKYIIHSNGKQLTNILLTK